MKAKYGMRLGGKIVARGTPCRMATPEEIQKRFPWLKPKENPDSKFVAVVFDGFEPAIVHKGEIAK